MEGVPVDDEKQYYRVVCPESKERIEVTKVWKSKLPTGASVTYGAMRKHFHRGNECEWSGHVGIAERLT